jgi:hypothetical protein
VFRLQEEGKKKPVIRRWIERSNRAYLPASVRKNRTLCLSVSMAAWTRFILNRRDTEAQRGFAALCPYVSVV